MNEKYTLDNLPLNKSAVVNNVNCKESLKNRIYDLGILNNVKITPVYKSPFGDPTAFIVKNAIIALRNKDCKNITVTPI